GLLLGRRTYDIFAAFWPNQPADDPWAITMNGLRKFVASRKLQEPLEWENSTLLGDVATDVAKLREQPGGGLVLMGRGTWVPSWMEQALGASYQLMTHPGALGGGRNLCAEGGTKTTSRLVNSQRPPKGTVILTYEPAREDSPASVGTADIRG